MLAGLHEPVIPLEELLGRAGAVLPWQRGPTALKVGVTRGSIVIERVAVVAHCPAVGVNVYTVVPAVAVLMLAGLHEPVIPLEDDAGRAGAVLPWQRGPIALKVGVIKGLTVTLNVAVVAH